MRSAAKSKRKYRILIADRGGVFRLGLKKLFAIEDDFRVVAQAENALQTAELTKRFQADLVFVQAEIEREGTGDLLGQIQQAVPHSRMVIVADAARDDEVESFVRRGASGLILRSADPGNFIKCAARVVKNGTFLPKPSAEPEASAVAAGKERPDRPVDTLTRREKSIIGCLMQGLRNREIASNLSITEQTVKNHLRTIFDKVGVSDRLELVLYAIHHHLDLNLSAPASGG
ncbi:MAG TPA: response regulator transcription factor [Terriglobia bacterium]|nr:response regulator transcription factor [Terriglobia bacterium]